MALWLSRGFRQKPGIFEDKMTLTKEESMLQSQVYYEMHVGIIARRAPVEMIK